MNRFLLAGLATLALSTGLTPTVNANTAFNPYPVDRPSTAQLAPSALVTMAYRGELEALGIPGYLGLTYEYTLGRIGAKELVQGAIAAKLLPAETANDQRYLNAVEGQLQTQIRVR